MAAAKGTTEPELRRYLRTLRRRKWIVVLTAIVVAGIALGYSELQTPQYQASAVLLLHPHQTDVLFNPATGVRNDPQRDIDTEIQVMKSQPVVEAVRKQLGVTPDVSINAIGTTDTVQITAKSTVPFRAAAVANAYSDAYITFRRSQDLDAIQAVGVQIQNRINDLGNQIDSLDKRIAAEPAPDRSNGNDPLLQQEHALVSQKALFTQRAQELQIDTAAAAGVAELVTRAPTPVTPTSPKPVKNAALGVFGGLILGISLAFLVDYLDDSIKGRDDVEHTFLGLPVLGMIPTVPGWKNHAEPVLISATEPRSDAAEAYRALRTSIQFMGLDRPIRTLLISSASASEGKSTTLANLGVALSRAGQRVIVVCCDLRRARIHEFFGVSNEIGFTSVLLGQVPLSAALQPVPYEERLQILASGPIPPNPSELLSGRRAVEVLTALQSEADIVLIDSPPVLPVTDAAVLSARVDAVLLVGSAGRTTRRALRHAVDVLSRVEAPIVGLVLNRVPAESSYVYRYGYQYPENANNKRAGEAAQPAGTIAEAPSLN